MKRTETKAAKRQGKGASRIIGAEVSTFEGSGSRGVVYPRFSHEAAVRFYSSWAYIASNLVAMECARVPLRLYVRGRKAKSLYRTAAIKRDQRAYLTGRAKSRPTLNVIRKAAYMGDDMVEVTEPHPAIEVLQRANDFANGYDMTVLRWIYLQLTGNAYMHPVYDGAMGVPSQVWLLPSHWVEVKPSKESLIAGYLFGSDSFNKVPLETEEVIQFKLPNPDSVYYGRGRVEAAWTALGLHTAKRETDTANFQNRGRPDWLLVVENAMSQPQIDQFQADMDRRVRGTKKSGRVLAVGGQVKAQQLNFPPDEIGDSDRVLDEISSTWGVPRAMLTGNMNVSGGGSEQADRNFLRGTVHPLLCLDEQRLNEAWLPLFDVGEDAVLAYDNPVPEDKAFELDRVTKLTAGGVITYNEARSVEGFDPVTEDIADQLLFNGRPLGAEATPQFGLNIAQAVPAAPQVQDIETTQDAVLNGAQVTAATAIVQSVAAGEMPRDAGIGQLEVLFNLSTEQAERIMGSAGTSTPTTPNPNPAAQAAREVEQTAPEPATEVIEKAMRDGFMAKLDQFQHEWSVKNEIPCKCGACANAKPIIAAVKPDTSLGLFLDSAFPTVIDLKADATDTERDGEPVAVGVRMYRAVAGILGEYGARVDAILESPEIRADGGEVVVKRNDAEALKQIEDAINEMGGRIGESIRPMIEQVIATGGENAIAQVRALIERAGLTVPSFTTGNPAVPAAARSFTEKLAGEVSQATLDTIRGHVAKGIELGETSADIAKRVRESGSFSPERAETIARSESARAYGKGAIEGWKGSGVVEGKRFQLSVGACLAAGSQVLKVKDGQTISVGIETLQPDDFVVGGSGNPCRVVAVNVRSHSGDIVVGPGFAVTPDHRFLTTDGWRPVGEYAPKAGVDRLLDFIVAKAKYVPSAFEQVVRLPAILRNHLWSIMPVPAIAEYDQIPVADHEIGDPSSVHGNLFLERNTICGKGGRHDDFNVSSFDGGCSADGVAMLGAVVPLGSLDAASDSRRVLREGFAARCTDAFNPRLEDGVALSALGQPSELGGAGPGTALLVRTSTVRIPSLKSLLAPFAGLTRKQRHVPVSAFSDTHAPTTAKLPISNALKYLAYLAADLARSFNLGVTTSLRAFPRAVFRRVAAKVGGASLDGKRLVASVTGVAHPSILHRLRTIVNACPIPVYDIQVADDECFILSCGLIAHNCEICEAFAAHVGDTVFGLDAAFLPKSGTVTSTSGETLLVNNYADVDGGAIHVNCRCWMEPVLIETEQT